MLLMLLMLLLLVYVACQKSGVVASLGGDSMPQVQDLQRDSQSQTTLCTKHTYTWFGTICEELRWKWGKWLFLTFPVFKQSLSPRPLYVQNALTKLEYCVNLNFPLLTSFIALSLFLIWLYQICITFCNLICGCNRWVKLTELEIWGHTGYSDETLSGTITG